MYETNKYKNYDGVNRKRTRRSVCTSIETSAYADTD